MQRILCPQLLEFYLVCVVLVHFPALSVVECAESISLSES